MIAGFTVLVVGFQLGLVGLTKALDIAEEGNSVYSVEPRPLTRRSSDRI